MLDTIQEIKENPIVNRFTEIAESYGVTGVYVNWQPGGANEGGLYFVCGLDKSQFAGGKIDVLQIIENEEKSIGDVRIDARAFRINGRQPLMIHSEIVNYCQQLDTLQNVYSYVGHPIPECVDPGTIDLMEMTWRNFTDASKSFAAKKDYEQFKKWLYKGMKWNNYYFNEETKLWETIW